MQSVKTEKASEFLGLIYKNVKMGSESILNLMPKVVDEKLKSDMTEQLNSYETYARRAEEILLARGLKPKEENMMTKLSAKAGMAMNTMVDSTTSHIAEMMIQGLTMGVTELYRDIGEAEEVGISGEALSLAKDALAFEENAVEKFKTYL